MDSIPKDKIPKDVLIAQTATLLGGDVAELPLDHLLYLITITQHATDLLLNEIERRGELTFDQGVPVIPYMSNYGVETILTRLEEDGSARQ